MYISSEELHLVKDKFWDGKISIARELEEKKVREVNQLKKKS